MNGMAETSARVAQLQSMLGLRAAGTLGGAGHTGQTSSTAFAETLSEALGATGTTDQVATGPQAVSLARTFAGVPYRWGGTDPSTGLDCSGLVQLVYGKLGVDLPRVAADQARSGEKVPSLAAARPGDLVFFGSPAHHVGIYAGDGKMIDAPRTGSTVGVHDVAGYGTVSQIRRVGGTSSGSLPERAGVLDAAATELLSASGLAASRSPVARSPGGGAGLAGPYASLFTSAGHRYGVDPALLSAVAKAESGYRADAVSSAGARGLMQLMPGTARSLGVDPDDPAQAVDGAARLLKDLLGRFGGRTDLALAGYNAGPGAVRRYGGIPPYSETRTYVQRVTRAWEALR